MNKLLALAALAGLTAGTPAAATITIYDTPGAVQPDENVLFQAGTAVDNTARGITNNTLTLVSFVGNEPLDLPKGQARITAVDGGLRQLSFGLTDPILGFTTVEFNIFKSKANPTLATLIFTDQTGALFVGEYGMRHGDNFFSARATNNEFITNVFFTLSRDVQDVRQVRIGGIGPLDGGGSGNTVPEPSAWALMLAGFGLVGVVARRRSNVVAA